MKKEANKTSKIRWGLIVIIVLVILAVSSFGSLYTANPESSTWYNQVKSPITPPGYIIGGIWTILYILMGISIYLSLKKKNNENKTNKKLIIIWIINLLANALWTYFFFKMQNPLLAFTDLIIIWITCLILIIINWKKNFTSSYLIMPYLLWLTFAGILNYLAI
jgi:tryptophan-rich sensory protein